MNVEDRDLRGDDVLAGVKLQRRMETAAYRAAGESYKAPAQRVGDFMASAGKFNRSQSEASLEARGRTYVCSRC